MAELTHSFAGAASASASAPVVTPEARAALGHLADVVVPPPVSWTPQTIGWWVLAGVLLLVLLWILVASARRWHANRYRRAALAELRALDARLRQRAGDTALIVDALPELLKRTALAAWPREKVASLSGAAWVDFLSAHAGRARSDVDRLRTLLDDAEYRPVASGAAPPHELVAACRRWIEEHRVPA
jgi:hypothetical protein